MHHVHGLSMILKWYKSIYYLFRYYLWQKSVRDWRTNSWWKDGHMSGKPIMPNAWKQIHQEEAYSEHIRIGSKKIEYKSCVVVKHLNVLHSVESRCEHRRCSLNIYNLFFLTNHLSDWPSTSTFPVYCCLYWLFLPAWTCWNCIGNLYISYEIHEMEVV